MPDQDYYTILGVDKKADEKTIRRAFRKLAKKYHPDTNQGDKTAEQKFKEINEAYAILGDEKKRALYDKYGKAAFQEGFDPEAYEAYQRYAGGMGGPHSGGPFAGYGNPFASGAGAAGTFHGSGFGNGFGNGSWQEVHFDGADMDDILKNLFHGGGGAYERAGGRNGAYGPAGSRSGAYEYGGNRAPMKGEDLQAQITVSFEEAALGCEKQITLRDTAGKTSTLSVRIPAGIEDGKKIRLKGRGQSAGAGAAAGDLYLLVHVQEKTGYERKGQDVYVTVRIPFTTAVLGGEAQVPTLYGNVICRIPAGTQSGSRIRLKGKGIAPEGNPQRKGDQYIVVQIEVPSHVTEEQKKLLREYAAAEERAGKGGKGHAA